MLLITPKVIYTSVWCRSPVVFSESAPCCDTFFGQQGGGIQGLSPRTQVLFSPAAAVFLSGPITAARVSYIGERRSYILTIRTSLQTYTLTIHIVCTFVNNTLNI